LAQIGKNVKVVLSHISLKRVAVTGGLSSGKSSVCQLFKEFGAYSVSADEIVHRLLIPTTSLGQQVIALIGPEIVNEGQIVRSKIADKVFQQPELLYRLENLLHPVVHNEIERLYCDAVRCAYPLFIAEVPLLFEIGEESFYDATIAVVADPLLCMERFEKKTHCDKETYQRRMARQLSPDTKAHKATYIIVNNGSFDEMRGAVAKIYAEMLTPQPEPE